MVGSLPGPASRVTSEVSFSFTTPALSGFMDVEGAVRTGGFEATVAPDTRLASSSLRGAIEVGTRVMGSDSEVEEEVDVEAGNEVAR